MIHYVGARPSRELGQFIEWAEDQIGINHEVAVDLGAGPIHGLFVPPGSVPYVYAGVSGSLLHTADTLAHELRHYAQWRDGLPLHEKNVRRFAAAMVKRWAREKGA